MDPKILEQCVNNMINNVTRIDSVAPLPKILMKKPTLSKEFLEHCPERTIIFCRNSWEKKY